MEACCWLWLKCWRTGACRGCCNGQWQCAPRRAAQAALANRGQLGRRHHQRHLPRPSEAECIPGRSDDDDDISASRPQCQRRGSDSSASRGGARLIAQRARSEAGGAGCARLPAASDCTTMTPRRRRSAGS